MFSVNDRIEITSGHFFGCLGAVHHVDATHNGVQYMLIRLDGRVELVPKTGNDIRLCDFSDGDDTVEIPVFTGVEADPGWVPIAPFPSDDEVA